MNVSFVTHEGTGEEDTLDGGESDESLGESASSIRYPLQSPVSLLRDAGNYHGHGESGPWSMDRRLACADILTSINGIKQVGPSGGILDVGVNQKRVGLGVDVLPV